ncbi:MAG: efflux RND transporter periplasmic adaptor subunit [Gemmatimonadetes bacterium]|nr:efflux RND transporter periplasmic adaptor subunit [Gemmatimonadota bacterium]
MTWYARFLRLGAVAGLAGACSKEVPQTVVYQSVPVERKNIVVAARATGTVQPDTVVEVKSKASGEILDMKVETGSMVNRGTLLVRVDRRTPQNTLSQAEADLEVAKARLQNADAQRRRSDELFKSQSITEQEHENAVLQLANAKAEVVRAQVSVENARIAMEDTDVLAPITGTVIAKNVERGQVISSPTRDVGGGTVLLKMADLSLVQVRTLVDETDIGKIRQGLRATVTVDAFPNQPFEGEVLKIEPQAETQQNVTMFPVLVRIDNRGGLLKPGMNADVELHIGRRDSVLAIPNAALRTQRDVSSAARVLGIPDDQLQTLLAAAQSRADSLREQATRRAGGGDSARGSQAAGAAVAAAKPAGNTMTTPDGRTIQLPEGVTESQVREIFRKRFSGGTLTAQEQQIMQQLMRNFGGRGGRPGGRPPGAGGSDFQFGGNYIVFVNRDGQPTPVMIRTGLTDLDYSEVVTGLEETDSVLVLPSASLVQQQEEFRTRITNMTGGGGLPGMRSNTATGAASTTPGGAGGRPATRP